MAEYNNLMATINAQIKANGNQEITGPVLNAVLAAMVNVLGTGYRFMGTARSTDNPGTPDNRVVYIAIEDGTYEHFDNLVVPNDGYVYALIWDSSWVDVWLPIYRSDMVDAKLDDYIRKPNSATPGNFAEFDANNDVVDAGYSAFRIYRDLGYNAQESTIVLTAGETGKYVKCSTRAATANPNFNISAPFDVEACSELLIKTGYNPSDAAHAPLDITVIAIYEEMERTRVVQKKNAQNEPLYYEVDEDGNPTSVETTTVTDFPVYTTETYTEHRYLPNNEDRWVAIPDSGYYVANIPQSCKCVISYKPGVTDLNVMVVKHGALANLTSQIFGIYEHRTMAEAVVSLALRLASLEARISQPGNIQVGDVNALELLKFNTPIVLYGNGAPSSSAVPDNWPAGLPWDGVPVFKGQLYINTAVASGGLYYALGSSAVADWKNA